MTRREAAENYFRQGYNCSQSVALAFADLTGADKSLLLKAASPFGGGMGRLREVCGAVSGMLLVAGVIFGYDTPDTGAAKAELYAGVQELAGKFEEKHGSIVCRRLLGLGEGRDTPAPSPRTPDFYKKRPCAQLIGDAAELLDEFIRERTADADRK